jgi:glyoxylase-like metal-dependent hydrolase (beta-lactamase superfamily II)/quercetin dioxygenase-like cupin family protein
MLRSIAAILSLTLVPLATVAPPARPVPPAPKLRIELVGSDSTAFHVVAALIVGPSEVIAWDASYLRDDANRLADRIVASRARLKAIVISHPDEDHFMGATTLVQRFPGTPVYMTAAGGAMYRKVGPRMLQSEKARRPAAAPESLVTVTTLPSNHLTVDGVAVDVIPDLSGDVSEPVNSVLWIPSLRTVLAADLVFNGVHPWLGSSDEASRTRWRASLKTIGDLHPERVVAGHKRDVGAPDSPEQLAFMDRYLADFEAARRAAGSAAELRQAMLAKYGGLAVGVLLDAGAQTAFRKPEVAAAGATSSSAPASEGRVRDYESLAWRAAAVPGLEFAVVDGNAQGEGEYIVAMRYRAGTAVPVHMHPEEMRLIVARGQFYVGFGDRADTAGTKALSPGSVVVMPKGSHHFEGATTDAVVLVFGKGPLRIDLVGGG